MPELIENNPWQLPSTYESLADFIQPSSKASLRHADDGSDITHQQLRDYVSNFTLPVLNSGVLSKPVVAIILPNGPLLAATVLATATWYAAAPISAAAGAEQIVADIALSGASAVVSCHAEAERLCLKQTGLDVFLVSQGGDGEIVIETAHSVIPHHKSTPVANHGDDYGIILFTSGTSGNKKVVPMTMHSIVSGVRFVIESWALTANDTCLNMMPLCHVGGLIRNVFAPIFAGGSTICCAAFDGNLFWDVVDTMGPTWYYASPSMHSVILDTAAFRSQALAKSQIRLICNAAGGLLPALAAQLRGTFDCTVLPSYGMTECMPVSTPPIDYKLDRPGTSGISVGPDLVIMHGNGSPATPGNVGQICVRGEPTFKGYLQPDGSLDTSALTADGWFDTGDMGYMDSDGYLYITGRNKEVINRGGELVSPFEVENAIVAAAEREDSPIFGRVSEALAFSARHDVLQEVVGIVLVTPKDKPRADLRLLHEALRSSLQQVKWPVVVVYMNATPKRNGKVLRIKLGERLNFPCTTDEYPYARRHWEAHCPPPDTGLDVSISAWPCDIAQVNVQRLLETLVFPGVDVIVEKNCRVGTLEAVMAPKLDRSSALDASTAHYLKEAASALLDGYLVPHKFSTLQKAFPRDEKDNIDHALLQRQLEEEREVSSAILDSSTEGQIIQVFADLLQLDIKDIAPHKGFMEMGGDSLRAGKLLSILRSKFNMRLPIDLIFSAGSVDRLSEFINEELSRQTTETPGSEKEDATIGSGKSYSSTNLLLLILQLFPVVVFYPLTRAFWWTIFVYALNLFRQLPTNTNVYGRLFNLVLSIAVSRVARRLTMPWVGIALKWIIIGRHREGLYPMWGPYHTRWWMTQKLVDICGKGFFGSADFLELHYYRLLGAKIGRGVTLKNVQLGEWDLLEIGDGATLDGCIVRPMAGERNTTMYLGRISIGRNASVGVSSVVAPGTVVPDETCIGPNSSSHEMEDATEANRDLSATKAPRTHWALALFATAPLSIMAKFLYLLPWFSGLLGLAWSDPDEPASIAGTLAWFAGSERIGYHYLARSLKILVGPALLFGFVVLVRVLLDLCFGRLGPSLAAERGSVETWRMGLMKSLMPLGTLRDVTELFGQHYEATSVAIRMLGGKAGKRIYWPGTGPSIGDYHLLDVGNDVVFGSRSHLITSDGVGSGTVSIGDNAMIADRVVLLPNTRIKQRAVMGSGAMTKRDKTYEAGGTYVGSRGGDSLCLSVNRVTEKSSTASSITYGADTPVVNDSTSSLEKPQLHAETLGVGSGSSTSLLSPQVCRTCGSCPTCGNSLSRPVPGKHLANLFKRTRKAGPASTTGADSSSPFGRAFYQHQAAYYVFRPWQIFLYSAGTVVFTHIYWDASAISSIQILARIFQVLELKDGSAPSVFTLYGYFAVLISAFITVQVVLALGALIAAKWLLLGRRQPGNYDWDKSSYCQRWQLYLTLEKLRQHCLGGSGILSFFSGTAYAVWYFRALGATIGRDCALFVNGKPSLYFTEPDLLTLGDRVVVDNASLVGHVNTRGKFDLNRLRVGERSVLRTNSRLLSGAEMGPDSCLLEHTLIMAGDVVGEGETMQGWPATAFRGARV
ncbi:Uu.00g098030.m01.CDS01 [Anthostomella pinea]|uniref:Uu.00g098030.m01.CDS01 n=1 Tax=Anthostomella pinea TaxID=933095 RepID=A0AAI8YCP3_9PEZI|nr:Uu.00g098030.m01.CDS01 [Anthostomella pinea]